MEGISSMGLIDSNKVRWKLKTTKKETDNDR